MYDTGILCLRQRVVGNLYYTKESSLKVER